MKGLLKSLTVAVVIVGVFSAQNAAAQSPKKHYGKKVVVISFSEDEVQKKGAGRLPSSVEEKAEQDAAARLESRATSVAKQDIPEESGM